MGLISPADAPGFDALYGLELLECSEAVVRARVEVHNELRQSGGQVHGGVYGAIADALATRGTSAALSSQGVLAIGLTNHVNVLCPITAGAMHATARRRHRGRTTWVWEVAICDDGGQVCVAARVTVAVRDASR
jgi:1,4-dihydroxy-2-naphthoyl-CoA hydrolase